MYRRQFLRNLGLVTVGVALSSTLGCSTGSAQPTEEGAQADRKYMQDTAAANEKAAHAGKARGGRRR